ncbi:unnamed protein product [Caenorhabditis nigoni]
MLYRTTDLRRMIWHELVAREVLRFAPNLTKKSLEIKGDGFEIQIPYVYETTDVSSVGHTMCTVAYLVDNPIPFGKRMKNWTQTNSSPEKNDDPPMLGDILKVRVDFSYETPPTESYRFKVTYERNKKIRLLMEGKSRIRLSDGDPVRPIPSIPTVLPPPILAVKRKSDSVANEGDLNTPPVKKSTLMLKTKRPNFESPQIDLLLIKVQPYQKYMFVGCSELRPYQKNKLYIRLNEMGAHARNICYLQLFFKNQNLYVYFFDGFTKGDDAKIEAALFKEKAWEERFHLNNMQSGEGFLGRSQSFADLFKRMLVATRLYNLWISRNSRKQFPKKGEVLKQVLKDKKALEMIKGDLNELGLGILEKIQLEAH